MNKNAKFTDEVPLPPEVEAIFKVAKEAIPEAEFPEKDNPYFKGGDGWPERWLYKFHFDVERWPNNVHNLMFVISIQGDKIGINTYNIGIEVESSLSTPGLDVREEIPKLMHRAMDAILEDQLETYVKERKELTNGITFI